MSTRRADLLAAIVTELEGITIVNEFNTNIKLVEQDELKSPDQLNSEDFPAAYVVDTDETKENADLNEVQATLEFIIVGYVIELGTQAAQTAQAQRRLFQQDVERAVTANRKHGKEYVVDTQVTDIKTDKGILKPFSIFDMTITITYWHTYRTP